MKSLRVRWIGPMLVAALLAGSAAFAAEGPPAALAEPSGAAPATTDEQSASYGEREAQAQGLADFRGGHEHSLYIGGGTVLVLILLVIIVAILI